MSKLTKQDKIDIYNLRKQDETISSLSVKFNIVESNIKYLIALIDLALKALGYVINHKKVRRLMRKLGLYASVVKSKYKSYRGDLARIVRIYY